MVEAQKDAALRSVEDLKRRVVMLQYALRQERSKNEDSVSPSADSASVDDVPTTPPRGTYKGRVKADTVRIPSLAQLEATSPASGSAGSAYSITERSRSVLRAYLQEMGMQDALVRAPAPSSPSVPSSSSSTSSTSSTSSSQQPSQPAQNGNVGVATSTKPSSSGSGFDLDALSSLTGGGGGKPVVEPEAGATVSGRAGEGKKRKTSKLAQQMAAYAAAEGGEGGELGSLASLSAEEVGGGVSEPKISETSGVTLWSQKHLLRNHLDEVRDIVFHDTEAAFVSASDDCTLKMWNVGAMGGSRRSSPDYEPIYTFRGHRGPVYTAAIDSKRGVFLSGSADGTVRVWAIPPLSISPYDSHGSASAFKLDTLAGHEDSVWDIALHGARPLVASVSADSTVSLWNYEACVGAKAGPGGAGSHDTVPVWSVSGPAIPTAVTFVPSDSTKVVVTYRDSSLGIHDVETGKAISMLALGNTTTGGGVSSQPNSVATHPALPWVLTAHEDKRVVITDLNSGSLVESIVAHPDGVASIDVHPSGLYFMTGGHDSSVRWWDANSRKCVQTLNKHLQKNQASITTVAYHPALPYCATGGADSNVRVYGI